jgi:hypothetical protein
MSHKKPQIISNKEARQLVREQRLKYGDTLHNILLVEAKRFNLSVEEFLVSPASAARVKELDQVLELMEKKEYQSLEISAGAPGLGKHKS